MTALELYVVYSQQSFQAENKRAWNLEIDPGHCANTEFLAILYHQMTENIDTIQVGLGARGFRSLFQCEWTAYMDVYMSMYMLQRKTV